MSDPVKALKDLQDEVELQAFFDSKRGLFFEWLNKRVKHGPLADEEMAMVELVSGYWPAFEARMDAAIEAFLSDGRDRYGC